MFRKITLVYFILLLASCGKDVVIIEDPTLPEQTDETFEVNLVGFTTDEDRAYLPNMNVLIDGKSISSDESAFFHLENVLIGRRGKVAQLSNEGFLPTFFRVANHQNLENVMMNLQLIQVPVEKTISASGGSINEDGVELTIGSDVLTTDTDLIFKSFKGNNVNLGNEDQLYISDKTEYLLKETSLYISGSAPLNPDTGIDVVVNTSDFNTNNIDELSVFEYDEIDLKWKQKNIQITQSGNNISFAIDGFGWWTIADKVPALYGTLDVRQQDDLQVKSAEIHIFYEDEAFSGSTLYSSSTGTISTYFPAEKSISTTLDHGQFKSSSWSGFQTAENIGTIGFTDAIQLPFEGQVYDCDFTFADGYVAIKSNGQHKLFEISEGVFSGEVFSNNDAVLLQYYSSGYDVLNSKESDNLSLINDNKSFFSCADLSDNLRLSEGTNLLQGFDRCRVKVRPNETFVIGERENGDVFLVSFEGKKEGIYNGLFFFEEIQDDVKAEVVVNIVLYDELENKVGGFIKTEYILTGEELTISFIGNIE